MSERINLDRRFGGESSSVELVIVPKSAYFVSRCINEKHHTWKMKTVEIAIWLLNALGNEHSHTLLCWLVTGY